MDTNVTGRNFDLLGDFTTRPRVKRVFVRDLTEKTEGNATGIGLAEFTTTRLVEKMDKHKTWMNVITGIAPEKGAIPIHFDTDREVLQACFRHHRRYAACRGDGGSYQGYARRPSVFPCRRPMRTRLPQTVN